MVILTNSMWVDFSTALFIDRCAHMWVRADCCDQFWKEEKRTGNFTGTGNVLWVQFYCNRHHEMIRKVGIFSPTFLVRPPSINRLILGLNFFARYWMFRIFEQFGAPWSGASAIRDLQVLTPLIEGWHYTLHCEKYYPENSNQKERLKRKIWNFEQQNELRLCSSRHASVRELRS